VPGQRHFLDGAFLSPDCGRGQCEFQWLPYFRPYGWCHPSITSYHAALGLDPRGTSHNSSFAQVTPDPRVKPEGSQACWKRPNRTHTSATSPSLGEASEAWPKGP